MKIVSTAKMSERHQEKLRTEFPGCKFFFHPHMKEAEEDVQDADVLVTYGEDITPENAAGMRNLRWIQVLSAGMDTMPLSLLADRDILITNASGIHKIPMAEYTFGVMLQAARKMMNCMKSSATASGTEACEWKNCTVKRWESSE